MVKLYKPRENTVLAKGNISPSVAAAPGEADIAFGNTLNKLGQEAFAELKLTQKTGDYSHAYNKALVEFNKRAAQRKQNLVDEEGNPTHGTLVDDIGVIGAEVIEGIAGTIPDAEVRDKFRKSFGRVVANSQVGSINIARNQQLSFARQSVATTLNSMAETAAVGDELEQDIFSRQADQLLDTAVATGTISPDDVPGLMDKFRKQVANTKAERLISQDPNAAVELFSDQEASSKFGLREQERLSKLSNAESAVARQERAIAAERAALERQVNEKIKNVNTLMEAGIPPAPELMQNLIDQTKGTHMEPTVNTLISRKRIVENFAINDFNTQNLIVSKLKGQISTPEGLNLVRLLEKNRDAINQAKQDDIVGFALQQRIIPDINPIDFSQPLGQQLSQRRLIADKVEAHYDTETSGLTKVELSTLREKLDGETVQSQAQLFGEIVNGYGNKAVDVFADLAKTGAVQKALAGSLIAENNEEAARLLLTGIDLRKNKQIEMAPRQEFEESFEVLLPSYADPAQRSEVAKAAMSVYVAMSAEEGDFSVDIDKDRLKKAVQHVTNGDPIEIGGGLFTDGTLIEPPVKGMDSDAFEDWMESLTDQDISKLGGFNHMDEGSSEELQKYKLVTAGRGRYFVLAPQGDREVPVLNKEGEPFILDYHALQDTGPENALNADIQQNTEEKANKFINQLKTNETFNRLRGIAEDATQVIKKGVDKIMTNFVDKVRPVVSPRAPKEVIEVLDNSGATLNKHGINTPKRQRHFLAQLSHESAGFSAMVERRSDESAERKYGVGTRVGRILGNTRHGDGAKYKGRGFIQLTGRDNYSRYGKKIGQDLVNNPELAADPAIALEIAAAYWASKGLNRLADQDNLREITRRINGGFNGLSDRKRRFDLLAGVEK